MGIFNKQNNQVYMYFHFEFPFSMNANDFTHIVLRKPPCRVVSYYFHTIPYTLCFISPFARAPRTQNQTRKSEICK